MPERPGPFEVQWRAEDLAGNPATGKVEWVAWEDWGDAPLALQASFDNRLLPWVLWLAPEQPGAYVRDWKPVWMLSLIHI